MREFIAGSSTSRENLLSGKVEALKILIVEFLESSLFNTEWGHKKINDLLASHGIELTDLSVMSFLQRISGEYIGFLAFQVGDDEYEFYLVSGSMNDLISMSEDIQ